MEPNAPVYEESAIGVDVKALVAFSTAIFDRCMVKFIKLLHCLNAIP
jgi:hypothetical protein